MRPALCPAWQLQPFIACPFICAVSPCSRSGLFAYLAAALGVGEGPSKAQAGQLDAALLVQQHVAGLQVIVQEAPGVQVLQGCHQVYAQAPHTAQERGRGDCWADF